MEVTTALLASHIQRVANEWEIKTMLWGSKRKQQDQWVKVIRSQILAQHKEKFSRHWSWPGNGTWTLGRVKQGLGQSFVWDFVDEPCVGQGARSNDLYGAFDEFLCLLAAVASCILEICQDLQLTATLIVVADLSTLHSFWLRTGTQRRQAAFPLFSIVTLRVVPRALSPPSSSK